MKKTIDKSKSFVRKHWDKGSEYTAKAVKATKQGVEFVESRPKATAISPGTVVGLLISDSVGDLASATEVLADAETTENALTFAQATGRI